ncbi:MAG: hypothetical protein KDA28_07885, partial [Phycisphaerales bacterium]|nr:hypothetical protein [Phycisphaerales bacterium]
RKNNTVGGPGNEEFLVVIPEVSHASGGEEIVRWLPVVQEIRAAEVAQSTSQSPFSADSPEGGVVAVRINVPFQSSASASRRIAANDTNALLESGLGDVIYAQTTVTATNLEDVAPGAEVVVGSNSAESVGAYAGSYGLGSFQMLGGEVRPFRRILAGQAIYRREVFALNGP